MKTVYYFLSVIAVSVLIILSSCSKKGTTTPTTTNSNFYHGNLLGSPSTIIGPGNAILLRSDGTMREYANDYYSPGTSMTASDTAGAKIKLDGTYTIKQGTDGSYTTITATWVQPNGSPVLTYTLTGTITGSNMTGTFSSAGTGISSSTQFTFTNTP
ncbi:MAG: hypothetical protein QM731_14670 [Chitinophagaceae bacterium]